MTAHYLGCDPDRAKAESCAFRRQMTRECAVSERRQAVQEGTSSVDRWR